MSLLSSVLEILVTALETAAHPPAWLLGVVVALTGVQLYVYLKLEATGGGPIPFTPIDIPFIGRQAARNADDAGGDDER